MYWSGGATDPRVYSVQKKLTLIDSYVTQNVSYTSQ